MQQLFDAPAQPVNGTDITALDHKTLKPFRHKMQVMFEHSYSALDPIMTLTQTVAEPLHIHRLGTAREQTVQAREFWCASGWTAAMAVAIRTD